MEATVRRTCRQVEISASRMRHRLGGALRPSQRQSAGNNSANMQAGRDINLRTGVSVEEARQIALDVFHANFLKLRDVAEEVAVGRAEKITRDFLTELMLRQPQALVIMQDPDMQRAIFSAQVEYACSGEEDLEKVLVDLLADRAAQHERGIVTIMLNEAISAVPKLSADQRSAIAICFLVRYTHFTVSDLAELYSYLDQNWAPFAQDLPMKEYAYQHIEYVGAGSMRTNDQLTIEDALTRVSPGLFSRGFKREHAGYLLRKYVDNPALFRPCIRDPTLLELNIVSDEDPEILANEIGSLTINDYEFHGVGLANMLRSELETHMMSAEEIRADVIEHVPALNSLFHAWDESELGTMRLTSVGLVIGHAYWRRVTDDPADLSNWL